MEKLVKKSPIKIFMLGAFPPPIGGAAKNTMIIHDELASRGAQIIKLKTSVDVLSHVRSFSYHAKRFARNIQILLKQIAFASAGSVIYTVPDGGHGAWYTLAHLATSKIITNKQIIHHRTYKYLREKSLPVRIFTSITRSTATHVFLSNGMASKYIDTYGDVRFIVATNARFVNTSSSDKLLARPSNKKLILGHLSNLCRDKGFYEVANTFEYLINQGLDVSLVLAGPILEKEVKRILSELLQKYPDRVRYDGPVSGEQKDLFYSSIDVFLFPTQFEQEAQPNVIYEAFAAGALVMTLDRGCIQEMVPSFAGKVFSADDSFAKSCASYLINVYLPDESKEKRKQMILDHVSREASASSLAYTELYNVILGEK